MIKKKLMPGRDDQLREVDHVADEGVVNSTWLSDDEVAQFLALATDADRRQFLLALGRREWEALEEIKQMEAECQTLQAAFDGAIANLVNTDLLQGEQHEDRAKTWERVVLDMAVGAARGDIQTIQIGLKLKEKLGLSDEEKEEINFREIAPGNARWDDTTRLWPVEFEGQEWRALQQFVRAYQAWPMDQRSEELYEKVVNQI